MIFLEFRVPLPIAYKDAPIAYREMTYEATNEVTGGGQGCVWTEHELFDNTDGHIKASKKYGYAVKRNKGRREVKEYHVANMCPAFIKAMFPSLDVVLYEETYNGDYSLQTMNAFSLFKPEQVSLQMETLITEKKDETDNIFNLTEKELKSRSVFEIDLFQAKKFKKICDLSTFHSEKQNRGPFTEEWMKTEKDICYFYRLVRVNVNVFGLTTILNTLIKNQQVNFTTQICLEMVKYMDNWTGLTEEEMTKIEEKQQIELVELMKQEKTYNTFMDTIEE